MSDELWNAVKARQTALRESEGVTKARATRFWEQRRAQHLLNGLVFCGSCGSRLASLGRDYLACSAARGQGTCTNRKGVRRAPLEELIPKGLRQRLMAPDMVEEFVAAYHEEVNRRRRKETAARASKERELGEVMRKLEGLIDALAEGYGAPGYSSAWTTWRRARLRWSRNSPPIARRRSGCTPTSPRSTGARSSGFTRHSPTPGSGTRRSASCAG